MVEDCAAYIADGGLIVNPASRIVSKTANQKNFAAISSHGGGSFVLGGLFGGYRPTTYQVKARRILTGCLLAIPQRTESGFP